MDLELNSESTGIKIDGHKGKWYVLSTTHHNGEQVFLLEHESFGEDAAALIVKGDRTIVMDDVYNGFSDLE